MNRNKANSLVAALLLLGAAGCRNAPPCPDCEDPADVGDGVGDGDGDEPLPDLPCGGADLMTDSLNCGTCGHECVVWYEGTEWQAGGCEQGECSRARWLSCVGENFGANCEEICGDRECLPGGCSGLTALVFESGHFEPCYHDEVNPVVVLNGACDESIPWDLPDGDNEVIRHVMCCCEN